MAVVAHTFNPSTQEAEAGGSLWVRGQPGRQSEFQDNQDYTEKHYLEKQNKQKETRPFICEQSQALKRMNTLQFWKCFGRQTKFSLYRNNGFMAWNYVAQADFKFSLVSQSQVWVTMLGNC